MKRNANAGTDVNGFGQTAVRLSRSPLGIIALFIVLIYGFAALVLSVGGSTLDDITLKLPLVWFLVLFPVAVLAVFAWLVARHHQNLYGPGDFRDERLWMELRRAVEDTSQKVAVLQEVSPVTFASTPSVKKSMTTPKDEGGSYPDDPQKGRWGGKPTSEFRELRALPIRPLRNDPSYYRVPLEVRSTDPGGHPLLGPVTFYLHDTFDPDEETVEARDGVAKLEVVAYGAFTVGARTAEGVTLELDLSGKDVEAPQSFKDAE